MLRFESLENRNLLAADGVAATQHLAGDIDGSGDVGFTDFLVFSKNFGATNATAEQGDLDGDGRVVFPDFLILQDNFGLTLGDVDKDGDLSIEDAYAIRDEILTEGNNRQLDVNGDCVVDLADLEQVKTMLNERPGADINLDGVIDENDLKIVEGNFNKEVIGGWIDGDINEDGVVNFADFVVVDPGPF